MSHWGWSVSSEGVQLCRPPICKKSLIHVRCEGLLAFVCASRTGAPQEARARQQAAYGEEEGVLGAASLQVEVIHRLSVVL